ncbi:MAG: hypothetical protein KKF41_09365 [Actinobacteria bacterium]|nr:hypothetical protein [Actinomycetota bacterium]MBU1945209.1 hypothetical protein [Actinomycetota bacterium]MBU2687781.1 hypothetical protein [Actinomycetota bacterium]
MAENDRKDSILHTPMGELLKRDITIPDAFKRDLNMPEALKKEIPVGDILHKEINVRKQEPAPGVIPCPSCGQPTNSGAVRCVICGASIEGIDGLRYRAAEPKCLLDHDWFGGLEDLASP